MGVPAEAPATAWVRRPRGGANAKWSGTCCVPGGGGGGRGRCSLAADPPRPCMGPGALPVALPVRGDPAGGVDASRPAGADQRRPGVGGDAPPAGGGGVCQTGAPRAPAAATARPPPTVPRAAATVIAPAGGSIGGRLWWSRSGESARERGRRDAEGGRGESGHAKLPRAPFSSPPPAPPQVLRPSRHTHTSHAGLLSHDVSTAPGTQQQGVVGIQYTGLCCSGPPRRHGGTRPPPASTAARRLADGVGRVGWGARSPDARGAASEGETSQRALACAVRSPPCWGQCARAAPAPRLGDARVQRGHTASSAAGAERSRGPARRQASHPRTLSRPWPHRARRGRMGHIHGGRRDRSLSPPMTSVIDG